ncbi:putative D-serine dehydratase [Sporosarcina sp. NCCP-2716]|uniref:D-serine ammonia-lyase n=1 Tax=Sporosarcina sp. NCCP-2716 TaxID=2943679 RepID=UPI00203A3E01|nr:D-serine ammonia-lyase [Sporosarcina sp. NCCP-2716]GKV68494.1 putative D-serine dehydratase [Sporosarcina sp. NCCP-2716]
MTGHNEWMENFPLIRHITDRKEWLWVNPDTETASAGLAASGLTEEDVKEASDRFRRFAPYFADVFPETTGRGGLIESPLSPIPAMQATLASSARLEIPGMLLLKQDNALPVSGSIKARGGFHEVLRVAETLAGDRGLIDPSRSYVQFKDQPFKDLFASRKIAVGSTGNLGLSIGILSAEFGFDVTVHMSADAKQWKKDLLRSKGVHVKEYEDDYSKAVEQGRAEAENDPSCHFVDDENSRDLFLGYAVAGERVAAQLAEQQIPIDADHPLFVYLPCGVGGGPGGVAFGLKLQYGDAVRCYFAEPVSSPCMLLGMMTKLHDTISVRDVGLDNRTAADGLAVGRPSGFVGKVMAPLLDGVFTVEDRTLFGLLRMLADTERIMAEPSALAGMMGPLYTIRAGRPAAQSADARHLVWSTGGGMVPEDVMEAYYDEGESVELFPGKSTKSE